NCQVVEYQSNAPQTNDYGQSIRNANVIDDRTCNNHTGPVGALGQKIAIWGTDDRKKLEDVLDDSYKELINQVTKITTENGTGTALFLGKNCDVSLTSAHPIYRYDNSDQKYKNKAKQYQGIRVDYKKQSSNRFNLTLKDHGLKNDLLKKDRSNDWAVYVSDKRIQRSCFNVEIDYDGKCEDQVFMIAFHIDTPNNRRVSLCKTYENKDNPNIFEHCCDSKKRSSGAPILCYNGGDIKVIGIQDGYHIPSDYKLKSDNDGNIFSNTQCTPGKYYNVGVKIKGRFKKTLQKELLLSEKRFKGKNP
ncbi:hypothetical protein N9W41_01400, partial [bacterium]|nr:hypothetical protein [bacterium]